MTHTHFDPAKKGKWYICSVENEIFRYETAEGLTLFDREHGLRLLKIFNHQSIMMVEANFWHFKWGEHKIPLGLRRLE